MDERLEKLTDLDKKVNSDDLIYRYEGNTPDLNFDEFDNALALVDKIRDGKISLTDVKKTPQKTLCIILKRFIKQEMKLLHFMMIIL